MKRLVGVMGLVVFLTVVLTAGISFAQKPGQPGEKLPDFTIDKLYLTKDCRVAVVVKNLGPGVVPDDVWTVHTPKSAGIYLYKNGTGWGGGTIWKFDPAKNLKAPGGTATYVSTLKVTGTAGIKAVVDLWNVVLEANEGNNSLETKLACKVEPTKLDCRWQQIKVQDGVDWKCVGKDCDECTKMVESKAQSLKGETCCRCEKGPPIICRGECCADVFKSLAPMMLPRR